MAGKSVPKVKQKLDKKDLALSLAFLLPAILITVIFVIYPVFDTVGLSFRKWNGMFGAAKQWVGLENYQKIFSDNLFWNAMLMLYTQGFSYKLFGRSSAYGVILLVLGVVLSLVTNHLFREDKDLAM